MKESHGNENLQPEDYCVEEVTTDVCIMVGLDEYVTAIKEQLCGFSYQFQIIPIVGTAGIGKTTLVEKLLMILLFLITFIVVLGQPYPKNIMPKELFEAF